MMSRFRHGKVGVLTTSKWECLWAVGYSGLQLRGEGWRGNDKWGGGGGGCSHEDGCGNGEMEVGVGEGAE